MPRYKTDYSGLEDGAIINGATIMSGDNLTVQDLGFDHGPAVAESIQYAPSGDALVIHDRHLAVIRSNVVARNLIGISKDTSTPWHGILFEGLKDSIFDNIHGCHSYYPIAVKAYDSKASNFFSIRAGDTGVYFKSDAYAPCRDMEIENISYDDQGSGAGTGVCFLAATEAMSNMTGRHIRAMGGNQGFKIVGGSRTEYPANSVRDCAFTDVICEDHASQQIYLIGALDRVRVDSFVVANSASEQSIIVSEDALGVNLTNGRCLVRKSSAANCLFYGATEFDNLTVCDLNDDAVLGGITVVPDPDRPRIIGSHRANLEVIEISAPRTTLPASRSFLQRIRQLRFRTL